MRKKIHILAMGGTIAGRAGDSAATTGYQAGVVGVEELIAAVPQLAEAAEVSGEQLAAMSQAISYDSSATDDAKLSKITVYDQFAEGKALSLQVGDTNKDYQRVSVDINDMSATGLGLSGLDLSTQEGAAAAIDTIKTAVNAVSTQRGKLGALQNRLDHTLNNLDATTQNITAAESQIRDTDMAKEMTEYSKNNILAQAAQSMLAQANSMPQGVLSLLG